MQGTFSFGREVMLRAIPVVLPWVASALFSTLRLRFLRAEPRRRIILAGRPFIGILWHQQMLLSQLAIGNRKAIFMSSRSRDGEISTRVLRRQGHGVVRGSSSAGGAQALREVIRLLRLGYGAVMIADGPKGPPRILKDGVILAAQRSKPGCILAAKDSGAPLIPIACAFSRALILRNWDETAIPYPFSSAVIGYGNPIIIPKEATRVECEVASADLDTAMLELERRCRAVLEEDPCG